MPLRVLSLTVEVVGPIKSLRYAARPALRKCGSGNAVVSSVRIRHGRGPTSRIQVPR